MVTTSAGIDVKVLGTKFNVASYENDEQVTTTLAEGSVEVGDEKGSVRLKPEEQALFCKGDRSLRVQKVDVGMYLAWKDGKFVFEDATIEAIMTRLERWYDIKVFYGDEQVKQQTFTGIITRHSNVKDVLYLIGETAVVKFDQKDNVITVRTK